MSKRRVVVTGLGIVCPVGNNVSKAWQNILAGQCGIDTITRFDATPFSSHIAGEVKDFDVTSIIPAKDARRMDTFIHYGLAAGIEARTHCRRGSSAATTPRRKHKQEDTRKQKPWTTTTGPTPRRWTP